MKIRIDENSELTAGCEGCDFRFSQSVESEEGTARCWDQLEVQHRNQFQNGAVYPFMFRITHEAVVETIFRIESGTRTVTSGNDFDGCKPRADGTCPNQASLLGLQKMLQPLGPIILLGSSSEQQDNVIELNPRRET